MPDPTNDIHRAAAVKLAFAVQGRVRRSNEYLNRAVLHLDRAQRKCSDPGVRLSISGAFRAVRTAWAILENTDPPHDPAPTIRPQDAPATKEVIA